MAGSATFMYMSESVGIAELRQNLSVYLRRVSRGERLVVTDRNRPVAQLGPAPATGPALDRLIAEGRVAPGAGRAARAARVDGRSRLLRAAPWMTSAVIAESWRSSTRMPLRW